MKRTLALLLAVALLTLAACAKPPSAEETTPEPTAAPSEVTPTAAPSESAPSETPAAEQTEPARTILPLTGSVDLSNLWDATLYVAFNEREHAYLDDEGRFVLKMQVYDPIRFDAVDISMMQTGDTLRILDDDVTVESLETTGRGITVNQAYNLFPDDGGTYVLIGANDHPYFTMVGEVTLPVGQDFRLVDSSDLELGEQILFPGDLLTRAPESDVYYVPENTTVQISEGIIVELNHSYMP